MLFKADMKVTLKRGVLDPQGSAVGGAVKALGYGNVSQVRIGKLIELWVEAGSEEAARETVQELGRRILANPVMETFTFTIAPAAERPAPAVGATETATQTGVK
jgi:phosphoribosylformylglycinamidine synthase PurS subunit